MTQFQKIAIGLLGLTNPEMFIPRPKPSVPSTAKIEAAYGERPSEPLSLRSGRGARGPRPQIHGDRAPDGLDRRPGVLPKLDSQ
jgi:hypothetical protein